MEIIRKVKLAYFSGTGCTKLVSECFYKQLIERGLEVEITSIKSNDTYKEDNEDILFILYAVHVFNAPKPVYEWIENISGDKREVKAVVISVSGGGEITPNTACRLGSIKRLEKKGYKVVGDYMLVMPSNCVVATKDEISARLISILPVKVNHIIDNVLKGRNELSKPKAIDRLISSVGEYEKHWTKYFGRKILVNKNCNGCGLCSNECPGRNIKLDKGRPVFGWECIACLGCIYKCPKKALEAGLLRFMILKDGFDIEALKKSTTGTDPAEVITKGLIWKGVRDYLTKNR